MTTKREQKAFDKTLEFLMLGQATLELLAQKGESYSPSAKRLAKQLEKFVKEELVKEDRAEGP